MPVVGGLSTKYEYRCNGSNNTGGVRPAELIAMGTISVARKFEGSVHPVTEQTFPEEARKLTAIGIIGEKWLKIIPNEADFSMTLLPQTGEHRYKVTVNETTKEPHYELLSESAPEEENVIKLPYTGVGAFCLRVVPILDRNKSIEDNYNALKDAWEKQNADKEFPEEMTSKLISAWKVEAERTAPAVEVQILKLEKQYVEGLGTGPNENNKYTSELVFSDDIPWFKDDKTWTPQELDNLGFLSIINSVWPA